MEQKKEIPVEFFTKKGELKKDPVTKLAHNCIIMQGEKVYTGKYSGTGKHTKSVDYTPSVVALLTRNGYLVEYGNDAPRGGVTGNFVIVK